MKMPSLPTVTWLLILSSTSTTQAFSENTGIGVKNIGELGLLSPLSKEKAEETTDIKQYAYNPYITPTWYQPQMPNYFLHPWLYNSMFLNHIDPHNQRMLQQQQAYLFNNPQSGQRLSHHKSIAPFFTNPIYSSTNGNTQPRWHSHSQLYRPNFAPNSYLPSFAHLIANNPYQVRSSGKNLINEGVTTQYPREMHTNNDSSSRQTFPNIFTNSPIETTTPTTTTTTTIPPTTTRITPTFRTFQGKNNYVRSYVSSIEIPQRRHPFKSPGNIRVMSAPRTPQEENYVFLPTTLGTKTPVKQGQQQANANQSIRFRPTKSLRYTTRASKPYQLTETFRGDARLAYKNGNQGKTLISNRDKNNQNKQNKSRNKNVTGEGSRPNGIMMRDRFRYKTGRRRSGQMRMMPSDMSELALNDNMIQEAIAQTLFTQLLKEYKKSTISPLMQKDNSIRKNKELRIPKRYDGKKDKNINFKERNLSKSLRDHERSTIRRSRKHENKFHNFKYDEKLRTTNINEHPRSLVHMVTDSHQYTGRPTSSEENNFVPMVNPPLLISRRPLQLKNSPHIPSKIIPIIHNPEQPISEAISHTDTLILNDERNEANNLNNIKHTQEKYQAEENNERPQYLLYRNEIPSWLSFTRIDTVPKQYSSPTIEPRIDGRQLLENKFQNKLNPVPLFSITSEGDIGYLELEPDSDHQTDPLWLRVAENNKLQSYSEVK